MNNVEQFKTTHNEEIDEKFHQLNLASIGHVAYWSKFLDKISEVDGDIVECGIGRGRSLIIISSLNSLLKSNRTIYAYDSFEGFPEPTEEDNSFRNPKKGEWSKSPSGKYEYSKEFMESVLTEAGVKPDENLINLKKGFFSDSLKEHPEKPIALLHVDGDLYQSYMDVLTNLYNRVAKGGIIVFDDFLFEKNGEDKFPGARLAVEEFLGDKVKDLKVSIRGTAYLIKD